MADSTGGNRVAADNIDAASPVYGSDVIADGLRTLGIGFIAINPGASYRGLHDSLVNHLGNHAPQIVLCLHEGHAVGVAHGYAKVTGKSMAVALHSNVGLMQGSMGIFNAWCDRAPMLVIGATGPVDAALRRPWIDWIHTARDQGALVRPFVKWDDQPGSVAASQEALLRGYWLANSEPKGPIYLNFDAALQEAEVTAPPAPLAPARYLPEVQRRVAAETYQDIAEALKGAGRVVFLVGRVSRSVEAWQARVALAEALQAQVIFDDKIAVGFPSDHRLVVGGDTSAAAKRALAEADVVLSFDWVDLAGIAGTSRAKIIHISMDFHLHNGWSMDHQGFPAVDMLVPTDTDSATSEILALVAPDGEAVAMPAYEAPSLSHGAGAISVAQLTQALRAAVGNRETMLCRLPSGWRHEFWPLRHPLDYVGASGGAGLGASPSIAVGCALALREAGSDRLAVCVTGDGDFLMGAMAVWTAAREKLPLLYVVANNRVYQGDVHHQRQVAEMRGRDVANAVIGLEIDNPEIDIAALARAQGAVGFGPVERLEDLAGVLKAAVEACDAGAVVVVDVRTRK